MDAAAAEPLGDFGAKVGGFVETGFDFAGRFKADVVLGVSTGWVCFTG